MKHHRNFKGYSPFDKLRKKRTGYSFDAVNFYSRDIDLPAIAGVVEAARRTYRKAGETNEDRIEEAVERVDAMARADASNEFYGGPKFNAARFAKQHNIDMDLRFNPTYERKDLIVANPPRVVTPPKAKPKPSPAEMLYPNEKPGRRRAAPVQSAAPRAADKQGGVRKLTPAEILYPNERGRRDTAPADGTSTNDKLVGDAEGDTPSPTENLYGNWNRGNNVPALGEEAKAAYKREFNAAKEAAEARGELFDAGEFFKNHGRPMIEAAAQMAPAVADADGLQGSQIDPGEALDRAIRTADIVARNLATGELNKGADLVTGWRGRVNREMRPLIDALVFEITQYQLAEAIAEAADAVAADITAQGYSEADVAAAHAAALAEAKKGSFYAAVHAAGQAATSRSASAGGGGTGVPGTSHGHVAGNVSGHDGRGTGYSGGASGLSGSSGSSGGMGTGTGSAPRAGGPGPKRE